MNSYQQQSPPSSGHTTPAAEPRRVRRVGTFTLGISLIATGIVLMLTILVPGFDPAVVCSFAPVLLILLGGEMLYNHFFHRSDLLRYDFLSTFFCLAVMLGASVVGVAAPLYQQFGPANHRLTAQVEQQLREEIYRRLEGNDRVLEMQSSLYIDSVGPTETQMSYRELQYGDYLHLTFLLDSLYPDPESFAQDCRGILDALSGLGVPNLDICFEGKSPDNTQQYRLDLPDQFSQNLPAQRLASLAETLVYDQELEDYRSQTAGGFQEMTVGESA